MEKILTVEIAGSSRQVKESDLKKIEELNRWYKETAMRAGISQEKIEEQYTIRIVKD